MKIVKSLKELVDYLKKVHNLKPGDKLNLKTPQFEREYELEIKWQPKTVEEFDAIKKMPKDILYKMGLCVFDEIAGKELFLYPSEWFENIPENHKVCNVRFIYHRFNKETASRDVRYGCLQYGFLR